MGGRCFGLGLGPAVAVVIAAPVVVVAPLAHVCNIGGLGIVAGASGGFRSTNGGLEEGI